MPSVTIKGLSEELLQRLRDRASGNQRSVNREIIAVLEAAVRHAEPAPAADWGAFAAEASALRERLRERYGTLSDSAAQIRDARDER